MRAITLEMAVLCATTRPPRSGTKRRGICSKGAEVALTDFQSNVSRSLPAHYRPLCAATIATGRPLARRSK
jgi:hypothetical protein